MKMPSIGTGLKAALLPLVIAMPLSVVAQSIIQRSSEAYLAKPEIKFQIAGQPTAPATLKEMQALAPVTSPVSARSIQAQVTPAPVSAPVIAASANPHFLISASDRTVRDVLTRWAAAAGWIHGTAHWTIDKDHPIEGGAGIDMFPADFKEAVRLLLSSTDLTDRPVQPCFYTNRVVRVIPRAAMCDKST